MADETPHTLFGFSPAKYGFASVVAACVAGFCGAFLLVVLGWVLWLLVLALSVLAAVVCGLLGVGAGLYYKDWLGIVSGAIGLAITGFGVWFVMGALTNW